MSAVTEETILEYLKNLKFKPALFGVSKADVLLKMKKLNTLYRMMTPQGEHEDQLYREKVEAVAKAFVDIQQQADGIIAQAQKQADAILEEAREKADRMLRSRREQLRQEEKMEQERLKKLQAQKEEVSRYLALVRDSTREVLSHNTQPVEIELDGKQA